MHILVILDPISAQHSDIGKYSGISRNAQAVGVLRQGDGWPLRDSLNEVLAAVASARDVFAATRPGQLEYLEHHPAGQLSDLPETVQQQEEAASGPTTPEQQDFSLGEFAEPLADEELTQQLLDFLRDAADRKRITKGVNESRHYNCLLCRLEYSTQEVLTSLVRSERLRSGSRARQKRAGARGARGGCSSPNDSQPAARSEPEPSSFYIRPI